MLTLTSLASRRGGRRSEYGLMIKFIHRGILNMKFNEFSHIVKRVGENLYSTHVPHGFLFFNGFGTNVQNLKFFVE